MIATFALYHAGQYLTACRMSADATDSQARARTLELFDKAPSLVPPGYAPFEFRARLLVAQVRRFDDASDE